MVALYAAKKAAEIAPGVGQQTDMHLMLRTGPPVHYASWPALEQKLAELHQDYSSSRQMLSLRQVDQLQEFLDAQNQPATQAAQHGQSGAIIDANSGASGQGDIASPIDSAEVSREVQRKKSHGKPPNKAKTKRTLDNPRRKP